MAYRTGDEQSAIDLIVKRIGYDVAVPPVPGIQNFEKILRFYGLQDGNNNFIIPNPTFIKYVSNSDTVLAFDFVANAFLDFQKLYVDMLQAGKISKESVYTNIIFEPFEGWYNFEEEYRNNVRFLIKQINSVFLSTHEEQKKIINIDKYIESFMGFFPLMESLTVTRAKMLSSVLTKRSASGLVIKLADEQENDDQVKWEKYLNDPNFKAVVTLAQQTGFYVSKNSPWTLVANLGSPVMKFYMRLNDYEKETEEIFKNLFSKEQLKYAQKNAVLPSETADKLKEQAQIAAKKKIMSTTKLPIEKIFKKYYFETAMADFNTVKNMFYFGYTSFLITNPEVREIKRDEHLADHAAGGYKVRRYCPKEQQTIQVYKSREYISENGYNKKFDDYFFLKIFLFLKNYENGKIFSENRLKVHLKSISKIKKRIDTSAAIMYINSVFKGLESVA